jgi:DNA polymerase-3 subunit gamma/tau
MAAAVGCSAQQFLYAVPSQADEVAAIGQQLGVQTILAIVQILDQSAARLRVSLHGRTLVELAVVRICELENLDDLAAIVAELRGEASVAPPPAEPAKKNVEPRLASSSLGAIPPLPTPVARASSVESDTAANGELTPTEESVLKRYQMAVEAAKSATTDPLPPPAPRVSRRQQAAEVSERPFVHRALELFEVAPGQFRYSPPEGE